MTVISTTQAENPHFLELPVITPKDLMLSKKIREERTIIYNAFLNTLKNLDEDTHKYIPRIQKKLSDPQLDPSLRDDLEKILVEQKELLARLQSEEEKKIFNFILADHKNIFKVDPKKIKEFNRLNEKNFSRLLVLVFKKTRERKLADEKSSEGGAIKKVVEDCVDEAHRTEAGDWFVGLKSKIPGVGFLRKIPGFEKILGNEEEEKNKKQLREEEVVTKFLLKSLLPIITLIIVILLGGLSGPMSVFGLTIPHGIVIVLAVFSFVAAEYKAVKGLFSNDEEFTSDGPDKSFSSHDKDVVNVKVQEQVQQKQEADNKQAEECGKRFSKKISDILKTPVQGAEKSVQNGSKEVIAHHAANPTPIHYGPQQEAENKRRANQAEARQISV